MPLVSVREEGNISVPESMTDTNAWAKIIAAKVNQILRGKTNNVGEVTLAASVTTTTVTVPKGVFGDKTAILFDPATATAATAFGSGSFYVSTRNPDLGTYVITHPNTADTDKIFKVAYIG
jgi:hypothetical protein